MFSELVTCPRCNGNKVVHTRMLPNGEDTPIPCSFCEATGKVVKPENTRTRLELIIKLLHQLELILGNDLPILCLDQTQSAAQYATSGAMNSRFFLVCNQEEMAEIISTELTKYREKQKKHGI
jgi:hypothetical protein